uniref:Uncharacterized protein n=1 Tax=Anopheles gambiae TaxID=7165 RepID=A0A2Y9D294_ANOGA
MYLRTRTVLFIVAVSYLHAASVKRSNEAIQYVTNLTRFINDQHFGTFVCWLLQFSDQHIPALLHNAMAQELSKHEDTVLLQVDLHASYSQSYSFPNVVIIFADALDEDVDLTHLRTWLDAVPYKTFVVILFKMSNRMLIDSVAENFLSYGIVNLIMVAVNLDNIFTFNYAPTRTTVHVGFPHPSVLLYNRLREFKTETLKITYAQSSFTYTYDDGFEGEDMLLFKLFFQRLGINLAFDELICDRKNYLIECLQESNNYIFVNRIYIRKLSSQLIDAIEMDKVRIFAPKGKPLTFAEILLKPFHSAVWMLLLGICVAVHLLCRLAPRLICNDLMLLALTGIEKRSLQTTGRFEKLFAISLIILFFQLKSAYETKLVSYMIDVPTEPDPKTIDELRQRDLKVIVDSRFFNPNQFHQQLAGLLRVTENVTTLLKEDALLINDIAMRIMAKDISNVDPRTGKQLYVPLEEILGETMPFFYFHKKCPFQYEFSTYRRYVFEAGLQQHWRKTIITLKDRRFNTVIAKLKSVSQQTVRGNTLKPIFIGIILLWVAALVVFLNENIIFYSWKWCSNSKNSKIFKIIYHIYYSIDKGHI